jgi:Uma2 family endonuclease
VVNPRLVVEVLSPSTELFNRTTKFERYRQLGGFEEYVLVSQDRPQIEWFYRYPDGVWRFDVRTGMTETLRLRSLGIELLFAEVYLGVKFPLEPPEKTPDVPPLPDSPPSR